MVQSICEIMWIHQLLLGVGLVGFPFLLGPFLLLAFPHNTLYTFGQPSLLLFVINTMLSLLIKKTIIGSGY